MLLIVLAIWVLVPLFGFGLRKATDWEWLMVTAGLAAITVWTLAPVVFVPWVLIIFGGWQAVVITSCTFVLAYNFSRWAKGLILDGISRYFVLFFEADNLITGPRFGIYTMKAGKGRHAVWGMTKEAKQVLKRAIAHYNERRADEDVEWESLPRPVRRHSWITGGVRIPPEAYDTILHWCGHEEHAQCITHCMSLPG